MLNAYKNSLLEYLKTKGHNPEMFVAEEYEEEKDTGYKVTLRNTPMWFLAKDNLDNYDVFRFEFTRFTPTFPTWSSEKYIYFETVQSEFGSWLDQVKQYLDKFAVPNLWEQIEAPKRLFSFDAVEQETGSYSDDEKAALRSSLKTAKLLITERYSPSEDQVEIINERFDYLDQSLDRLNKRDWKGVLLATVISISITLSLDTEAGAALLELFKQAFYQALYLLQ